MQIELTNFVKRQWEPKFSGTKMSKVDTNKFILTSNLIYSTIISDNTHIQHKLENHKSWNFCKYLYIKNDNHLNYDINVSTIKLDHTISQYVQSDYSSRTNDELAVLSRFISFPSHSNFKAPKANWICLVLYSKEQLYKEYLENPWSTKDINRNNIIPFELSDKCEYGIVAIMGLNECKIEPMLPITHLRNALGKQYGGNGEPIDIEEYNNSVSFWKEHILIK